MNRLGGPATAGPRALKHVLPAPIASNRMMGVRNTHRLLNGQGFPRAPFAFAAALTLIGWKTVAHSEAGVVSIGLLLVALTRSLASSTSFRLSLKPQNLQSRQSWRFLTISFALWVAADISVLATWIVVGRPSEIPSLADFLRLSGYLAAIAAFVSYPVAPPERFGRIRDLLDLAILVLAMIALAWLVIVRPVVDVGMAPLISVAWRTLGPAFDMVLGVLLVRLVLLSSWWPNVVSFGLMALAAGIQTVTDLGSAYASLQGRGQTGPILLVGWMTANLIFAFAAWRRASLEGLEPAGSEARRFASRLEPLLPIALTYLVVGFTAFDWRLAGRIDWLGIAVGAALSFLLVARQGILGGQIEMRQFAAIVNASADLAFISRADGQLLLANPALRRSVGREWAKDSELRLNDLIAPGEPLQDILSQALRSGWSGEVLFRREGDSTFPVSLSLRPVHDERSPQPRLAGTGYDLTKVKEREAESQAALEEVAAARRELEDLNAELERKVQARTQQLESIVNDLHRLNEELRELDRLKTEFVALVSHELRAPLTNIQTGVELVLTSYPKLKGGARESLELVQAETIRLTEFVETILDLSALGAGHFPLRPAQLDLSQVVSAVADRFFDKSARRLLQMEFPPDLPPVEADRRAVSSILFHLIDNALKYAPGGPVLVSAEVEDDSIAVFVADHGPGVPEPERERVFEMFHRLDSSDSREVYGHGLGLHLVRQLVEAMGGDIHIEEPQGGGAKIVFRIPRAR